MKIVDLNKWLRIFLAISFCCTTLLQAENSPEKNPQNQQHGDYVYSRPDAFDFLKKAPGDVWDASKSAFRKENWRIIAVTAVATGILIIGDQYILDKSKNLGDHLGISHTQYQKTFARIGVPFTSASLNIEGPFDSGSTLYFLGDGWLDAAIAGSFLTYGLAKSDNRALQTSSQIAESILASGAVVQTVKHITGRESPFTTDVPRGVWRFFPNQVRYSKSVPEYDAFPSGHLAAAMALVTVTSENYPEYRFIRPVGYSLMGVLGFQMLNNGVHWASDYPLALVLGYSFGHRAVQRGRRSSSQQASLQFYPVPLQGGAGVFVVRRFGRKVVQKEPS